MEMNLYMIKDTKTGYTGTVMPMPNDAVAIRWFGMMAADATINQINQYPDDIELWRLGTLNTDTGVLLQKLPEYLKTAKEYISHE